ncbi:MAG: [protein-PII] uridylyltransferase [Desulfobulbaceae bacterium]|nr:MAG: [protein-PII] uridylyltransferase [Desulfobulbaceae bacterium]
MTIILKKQKQALDDLWSRGLSGTRLLSDHSALADTFIKELFETIEDQDAQAHVAVIALGGYGRQELFPFSDIDLMILFSKKFRKKVSGVVDKLLYPLWDTGYEVGHGVRTIKESLEQARDDFVFQVALLDARLVAGSQELFDELLQLYRRKFVDGKRADFVQQINEYSQERRARFGTHSYLLEPNIKEGKGGLRDLQSMVWVAQVVFGIDSIQGIVDSGFLLQSEGERFENAHNMLVRIRNRLHYISSRKNDQLFFEQQEEMAVAFGYGDDGHSSVVEHFMRDVYGHLRTVAVTADLFFDHVNEILGLAGGLPSMPDRQVEERIELRGGKIQLSAKPEELKAKPYLLMRAFLAASRLGAPIHHRSKMAITENLGLISDKLRSSPRMSNPFLAVLLSSEHLAATLEGMLETGLLSAYIPEFAHIDTLAQHDVYHIYTVDRHLLQSVLELHRVVEEEPEIARLVSRLEKPLFLAALLHDIGKNSGRDHSEYGAELVSAIGRRLSLDTEQIEDLAFLVEFHLFIPENALRRDLNDMAFIKRCAETISRRERLAMLYLLSVADSRATGPSAWSDWKATLMRDMYLKVYAYLEHADDEAAPEDMVDRQMEEGVAWMREQVAGLVAGESDLKMSVDDLSSDYLSSFTPGTILEHLKLHRDYYRVIRQRSLVIATDSQDHWSILVMSHDHAGLLAKICGVMTLNSLTVINAQIFTWDDGTVVDVIDVRPSDGLGFDERDWKRLNDDLDKAINHRIGLSYRLYEKLKSSLTRKRELTGDQEFRVDLDNGGSDEFTIIEVHAADTPGQLYQITQSLADFGINIYKAFIATEIGQLIDVFYVLDRNGEKITSDEFGREVISGLMHAIGADQE